MLGEDGATVLGLETVDEKGLGDALLIIIPARGGSKRLKRKNLLPVNGLPMFVGTATSPYLPPGRVVVSTDDDEIASIARAHELEVHRRREVPDAQTILDASRMVARDLDWEGAVLTVQPTIHPLPPVANILAATEATVFVCSGQHDIWLPSNSRVSRELADQVLGIYYWPPGDVGMHPFQSERITGHYHDIDTPADYRAATARSAAIQTIAAPATVWNGSGHERRQDELALHLQHHRVNDGDPHPDLIIMDKGNTNPTQVGELRVSNPQVKIVTFEDRGPGAAHADAVINAILPPLGLPNEYHGGDYALIRPEFMGLYHIPNFDRRKKRVLILFGGTDAKGLTGRVAHVIKGMGHEPTTHPPFIAEAMMDADYLICGAGQIVQEAACVGIPTIVMAATQREASHGHLGPEYGNIFLGLAATVTGDQIRQALNNLILDSHLAGEMRLRGMAAVDGLGAERIVHIIEGLLIG